MNGSAQVIVIGAGFAGITAALRLIEKGVDVVVLEARDRVGGRVYGVANDRGIHVELGAQWIGPSMKRIHRLIEQEGLTKVDTYTHGKSNYYLGGRKRHGRGDAPPLSPLFLADMLQVQYKLSRKRSAVDAAAPWRNNLAHVWDAESIASFLENNALTASGKAYWDVFFSEFLSAETADVSFLDLLWGLQSCGSVGNALAAEKEWVKEGVYSLVLKLADRLGERVKLNSPVRRIQYDEHGASVQTDGETWTAQRVIVAMPPVLAGKITYSPPLPPYREQLTQSLKQGSVFKCIVTYERPFWRENGYSGIGYYDTGPVRVTVDGSPPDRPEGLMIALVSGRDAERFSERGREWRRQTVLSCLAEAFGEEAWAALDYTDKDWIADKWSMGGYGAHFRPGQLVTYGPALYEPVGPIHWAGTETATDHRLYMEGAIQSGERAADEVVKAIGDDLPLSHS